MSEKRRVHLCDDQRSELRRRLAAGEAPTRQLTHARILLKADEAPGGPGWSDDRIAGALEVSAVTIWRVRRRFADQGLTSALERKTPDRVYERKLDGAAEAHLVALASSAPPAGRRFWTLRLLADRMVELRFADGLSYETVRRTLKKTRSSPGPSARGARRPSRAASLWPAWKMS
jgi:transposase